MDEPIRVGLYISVVCLTITFAVMTIARLFDSTENEKVVRVQIEFVEPTAASEGSAK